MHELVKFLGAGAWFVGLIMLFVVPLVGVVILTFAVLATIWSVSKTRQDRHDEMMEALGVYVPRKL